MDAVQRQRGVGGVQERADIQAGAGVAGHPILIHTNHLLDGLQRVIGVHLRQPQTLAGAVQPGDILPGAEQLHLTVGATVGLQALEYLGAVVENAGGGGESDGAVGDDAGVVPAVLLGVVHDEHVVGKHSAEAQLVGGGQGAGMGILRNGDIHKIVSFSQNQIGKIRSLSDAPYCGGCPRSTGGRWPFPRR